MRRRVTASQFAHRHCERKQSNPENEELDCFVADAPRNDSEKSNDMILATALALPTGSTYPSACRPFFRLLNRTDRPAP